MTRIVPDGVDLRAAIRVVINIVTRETTGTTDVTPGDGSDFETIQNYVYVDRDISIGPLSFGAMCAGHLEGQFDHSSDACHSEFQSVDADSGYSVKDGKKQIHSMDQCVLRVFRGEIILSYSMPIQLECNWLR